MRKLVSIRTIKNVRKHPDADLLDIATIDGWQCVSKLDEFNEGEKCVYFEIDSFLPIVPEFEFLRKSSFKKMGDKEGLRLKTIKLRGELSQGLVLSLSVVKDLMEKNLNNLLETMEDKESDEYARLVYISKVKDFNKLDTGTDVTDLLGVEKYEAPIPACLSGEVEGSFPSFIRKTDQERIQNLYDSHTRDFTDNNDVIAEELREKDPIKFADRIEELLKTRTLNPIKNMSFEESLKLDGTSMTCFVVDTSKYITNKMDKKLKAGDEIPSIHFGVCGRNFELTETEGNTYWKVSNRDFKDKLIQFHKDTGRNIAIQGELMGEGIQKNREKLKGQKFFCFDIWDIDKQRYLTKVERELILDILEIDSVPILNESIKIFELYDNLEDLLKHTDGPSINHKVREGNVYKSLELVSGSLISFKIINNKFLLKGGD